MSSSIKKNVLPPFPNAKSYTPPPKKKCFLGFQLNPPTVTQNRIYIGTPVMSENVPDNDFKID